MQLVKYEAAKFALAEAKAVDEVKKIRDAASAMKAYAMQAKDKQLEVDASEIRIRAERRLGEMIRAQKEGPGLNQGAAGSIVTGSERVPVKDMRPTLADVGIDKKLSARSQAIASIPEEEFEETLAEHRIEQEAVTFSTMEKLAKKAHVANNSGNNEWYTPKKYIDCARKVMGSIDTDPASSETANKTVKATNYYSAENNGLVKAWIGNVWMNPPYAQPLITEFCAALKKQISLGTVKQACVLVNNATETKWFQILASVASSICFPSGRIKFIDPFGKEGNTPLQGQAILYCGDNHCAFMKEFRQYGFCVRLNHE